MGVLVTRPGADGQALAELLNKLGMEVVLEPLLMVRELKVHSVDTDGVQAYLSTSANGVRALINTDPDFSLPLFAVGDTTATVARELGFKTVHSASGDVAALANLVNDILDPVGGSLIHASGSSQAGDLNSEVEKYGFKCRREILYETETIKSLTPATVAAIKSGSIEAVLLYSPRTAETLGNLLRKSRLVRACQKTTVICLSQAVAAKLVSVTWKEIIVAPAPTQEALLTALTSNMGMKNANQNKPIAGVNSFGPGEILPGDHAEAPMPSRKSNTISVVFLTLLVVTILISGGSVTTDLWLPKLQNTFPILDLKDETEIQLKSLFGRLQKLESEAVSNIPRLEELEAERIRLQRQLDSTLSRITTLENSINSVKDTISTLDTGIATEADQATLDNLFERLGRLESERSSTTFENQKQLGQLANQLVELKKKAPYTSNMETNSNARAFLLAVGQLRSAIRSGQPFFNELSSLGTIGIAEQILSSAPQDFIELSKRGTPTLFQLRDEFSDIAGNIVQSNNVPKGDTLLNQIVGRISHSLKWRRIDVFEGSGVEAVVGRTERALKNSDLKTAVMELSFLPENSTPMLRPWLKNGRALLAADKLLAALQVKAVSLLVAKE